MDKPDYFSAARAVYQIRNLLAYYKGRDDDARVAYGAMLRYGIPKHLGGDFRARWGIDGVTGTPVQMVPSCIPPSSEDCCEVFRNLVHGLPIPVHPPTPTWPNANLPKGYFPIINRVNTNHVKGLGELVCEMVGHEYFPVSIHPADGGGNNADLVVSEELTDRLPQGWRMRIAEIDPDFKVSIQGIGTAIMVTGAGRVDVIPKHTGRILTCGVFPIWRMKDVRPESFDVWEKAPRTGKSARGVIGKLFYEQTLPAQQPPLVRNEIDWGALQAQAQNQVFRAAQEQMIRENPPIGPEEPQRRFRWDQVPAPPDVQDVINPGPEEDD